MKNIDTENEIMNRITHLLNLIERFENENSRHSILWNKIDTQFALLESM